MNDQPDADRLGEQGRLAAIARSNLLESRAEERFDRVTRLVARALDVPVALISIVDETRQFFKSEVGLPEPWASRRETPLTHSFCQHVVVSGETLRVDDANRDPLVRTNLAVAELGVVAYLGVPLRAPTGHILGSLCAIDSKPRAWTADDERALRDLATIVEDQIGLSVSEKRMRQILNTMPQMVWSTLPDGSHDFYNDRWYEFTGVPHGSTDGEGWNHMFHPDDQERAWTRWRHSLKTGEPYEIEYRLRHCSGEYRWTLGRALPILDQAGNIERWFGTCTDIDSLKKAEADRDLIANELSHRMQNIFAVVAGLISMSARDHPGSREFSNEVTSRIAALAKAHRYVETEKTPEQSEGVKFDKTVQGLIATVLAPYDQGDRITISGSDAQIDLRTASALALILHELATNSVKYGALSAGGKLAVACLSSRKTVELTWREIGGPIVGDQPTRTGFGTLLVKAMAAQLGASIQREWSPEGLLVRIEMPTPELTEA